MVTETDILDVLIVGAGPCGLAVAARLHEETPSAMFTDEEHQRYHWISKHSGRMPLVQARKSGIKGIKADRWDTKQAKVVNGRSPKSRRAVTPPSEEDKEPPGLSSSPGTESAFSFKDDDDDESDNDNDNSDGDSDTDGKRKSLSVQVLDSTGPRGWRNGTELFAPLRSNSYAVPCSFMSILVIAMVC